MSNSPGCRVPYRRALKAYAYAGWHLADALKEIKRLDFYVPFAKRPVRLANFFKVHQRDAQKIQSFYHLEDSQLRKAGVYHLYKWIRADEEEKLGDPDIAMVEETINSMRNYYNRRAVSVLLFQGMSPEGIATLFKEDTRAPMVKWNVEQIEFYSTFFWNIEDMTFEDWLRYRNYQQDIDSCKHYKYVSEFADADSIMDITWHGGAPSVTPMAVFDDIIARQHLDAKRARNDERARSADGLCIKAIKARQEYMAKASKKEIITSNPLEDLEILVKEEQEKKTMAFATFEDLDGDVNDPNETESDKDAYLDR